MPNKKRALISVSEKFGIREFAQRLAALGWEIISTGGTAKEIREGGVTVIEVAEMTGFPEMMGGRVKTLHPKVHGGLLALRDDPIHMAEAERNGVGMVDLVAVNLYPFEATVAREGVTIEEAIENIDIGGPAMLRSAAKNFRFVTVVVDPEDYELVLRELEGGAGKVSQATRQRLAVKAFRHTADYDAAIHRFLSKRLNGEEVLWLRYGHGTPLRYGENSHQEATLYQSGAGSGVAGAVQHHGREMSFNNYLDAQAALETVQDLAGQLAAVVIKHGNPCGLATGPNLDTALMRAWNGDRESAMGSVIALSDIADAGVAEFLRTSYRSPLIEGERRRFVEIVIAPDFTMGALDLLGKKSGDLRLLAVGPLVAGVETLRYRQVSGGILEQTADTTLCEKWEIVTTAPFPDEKRGLAEFAMIAAKHTKSNAIVLAREYAPGYYEVIGMGAGQPNRIDSLRKLAIPKAYENFMCELSEAGGDNLETYSRAQLGGVVLASDALFPFDDIVKLAHELGIRYIVQPGGSVMTGPGGGDAAVIATANALGIAMVFTGTRHFLH